ncbi:MAG TPA: hypothetical protein VJ276_14025 [Thermoanaerobaculia bacterium]|nr:hypothetical protein [Thermoanaerobaculia bacterium]
MRTAVAAALVLALAACRGEPTPRDYQNNPPAMTHPVDSSAQSPSNQGMPGPKPEPSTAAEGKTTQPVMQTTDTKLPDQAPTTATTATR